MKPPGIWSRAAQLAEQTPPQRNRFIDFLRAASIVVVVIGHWLMAAPSMHGASFSLGDLLRLAPAVQWLTWLLQVMPVFFIVGGYANAASWESARRAGRSYGLWLGTRLRRLALPVAPLLVVWTFLALAAPRLGVRPQLIALGSELSLTPTWFLAVYVMVVVLVPATHAAWRRFGMASFGGFALGAGVIDALAFAAGIGWLRWLNYAFVWLGVHSIGYAWRDGRLSRPGPRLALAAASLGLLLILVGFASYPVSMISVPGQEVSNSRPPTVALLALGMLHAGVLLSVEAPMRRWLERARVWTLTLVIQGSIMTLYLWHATVMVLAVGLAYWLGGIGLRAQPASASWWLQRPPWIAILLLSLAGFVALFGRFERGARSDAVVPPAWQSVLGALALCAGLTILAQFGVMTREGDLRVWGLLLTFGGVALVAAPRTRAT